MWFLEKVVVNMCSENCHPTHWEFGVQNHTRWSSGIYTESMFSMETGCIAFIYWVSVLVWNME